VTNRLHAGSCVLDYRQSFPLTLRITSNDDCFVKLVLKHGTSCLPDFYYQECYREATDSCGKDRGSRFGFDGAGSAGEAFPSTWSGVTCQRVTVPRAYRKPVSQRRVVTSTLPQDSAADR
ncbi:hypothetical protein BaRGS_00010774, partial [Batillaria attramentaria]